MTLDTLSADLRAVASAACDLLVAAGADVELPPPQPTHPTVLCAGALNAGKSSLLNDLTGGRDLPDTQAVTDTRLYGRLVHGEAGAWAVDRDGARSAISLDRARQLLSKTGPQDAVLAELDRVEIARPDDLLRACSLEDAPGADDLAHDGGFVRQDTSQRAVSSTALAWCVHGLPAELDSRVIGEAIEAGVPIHVVFTRWDEVDRDEEDGDPRLNRLAALARWGLTVPSRRVHFTSSFLHRGGHQDESGVSDLAAALREEAAGPALLHAQGLRELARSSRSVAAVAGDLAVRLHDEMERDKTRADLGAARTVSRLGARAGNLEDQLRRAVQAASGDLTRSVVAGCEDRSCDLLATWRTQWAPAWRDAVVDAIDAWRAEAADLVPPGEQSPRPPNPPPVPTVAFPARDVLMDLEYLAGRFGLPDDLLDEAGPFGPAAEVGRRLLEDWRHHRWVAMCAAAAEEAVRVHLDLILGAVAARSEELLQTASDEYADVQDEAERASVDALRAVRRAERSLRDIAERATRQARDLAR